MTNIYWLTDEDVEKIHRRSIQEFGGSDGTRDAGLLASALARPHNLLAYEGIENVFELAASYAEALSQNHPYIDGNKRTAFFCAFVFLSANGFMLAPETDRNHTSMMENLAQSEISRAEMAAHFKAHSQPV